MINERSTEWSDLYAVLLLITIRRNGYNPIQVWIPSLNSGYVFGEWKNLGTNTGSSLDSKVLAELRALCGQSSMFYRTMPCTMGSEAFYIESLRSVYAELG